MISLLRAELTRMRGRRAAWMLAVVALAIVAAIVVTLFSNHRREPTDEELSAAQQAYQSNLQYCRDNPPACGGFEPSLSDFLTDRRFHLADAPPIAQGAVVGFAVVAFLLGATFVGADWHQGVMGHQLLWEPRRTRVLLSKAAVVAGISAAGVVAASALLIAGTYFVAATRGTTAGVGPGFFGDLVAAALRGGLLGALASLLGFGLASITRSTAAAVGFGFAVIAVLERFLGVIKPGWRPWLVSELGTGVVLGEWRVYVPGEIVSGPDGFFPHREPIEVLITWQRGALVLAMYLTVLVGLAVIDFRRRDVP